MTLAEIYLADFEYETKITRRFLERLPADKLEWKPHDKSKAAGPLAWHIATIPGRIIQFAATDVAVVTTAPPPNPLTVEAILKAHDESADKVRAILPTFTDAAMQAAWRATTPEGKDVLVMSRGVAVRRVMLNHWIQHRGQFGVYLRLAGAKVPSSYGPSGDEMPGQG